MDRKYILRQPNWPTLQIGAIRKRANANCLPIIAGYLLSWTVFTGWNMAITDTSMWHECSICPSRPVCESLEACCCQMLQTSHTEIPCLWPVTRNTPFKLECNINKTGSHNEIYFSLTQIYHLNSIYLSFIP